MPLEIRELHIKVNVNQPPQAGSTPTATPPSGSADGEKEAIIAQCVEEVMEIIQLKKER